MFLKVFRIFAAFTIWVIGCEAGFSHVISEVFLRMNVIALLQQTCGSDPIIQQGIRLLRSDVKGIKKIISKQNDPALVQLIHSYGEPSPLETGLLPRLQDPQQAIAIANHLCQTKHIGKNLDSEMDWYAKTDEVGQLNTAEPHIEIDSDEEDLDANAVITEGTNENQSSFTSKSFEILLVGILIGSVTAHYLYLLKNSASMVPVTGGKSIRRPEL